MKPPGFIWRGRQGLMLASGIGLALFIGWAHFLSGAEVTFSFGVATFMPAPQTVEIMIKSADTLMYNAKKNGKNKIYYNMDEEALNPIRVFSP